jgi:hypothetical protein
MFIQTGSEQATLESTDQKASFCVDNFVDKLIDTFNDSFIDKLIDSFKDNFIDN